MIEMFLSKFSFLSDMFNTIGKSMVFFYLLGGLGVFLLGIKMMSEGLQKASNKKLRAIINKATKNKYTATFSGLMVTSVVQSSSATTVMVVSFVSAGLLTVYQSLGVIFGANIGTTLTAWIVSVLGFKIKIAVFALPAIGIGFFSQFIKKWKSINRLGEALLGFGLLFLGLSIIKDIVPNADAMTDNVQSIIAYLNVDGFFGLILMMLVGTALTVLFQSSSAVMALTLTAAASGLINFPTATAMVLGENIGTTITANLAAIGANQNARRAAFGHLLFNVLGVVWVIILFKPFIALVDYIIPGSANDSSSSSTLPYHISAFHTIFNITNTFIMLLLIKVLQKIIFKVMPITEDDDEETDLVFLNTPIGSLQELSLGAVRKEIHRMMKIVQKQIYRINEALTTDKEKIFDKAIIKIFKHEKSMDILEDKINEYIALLAHEKLTTDSTRKIIRYLNIISDIEKIGDYGEKIGKILKKNKEDNLFSKEDEKTLLKMSDQTKKYIDFTCEVLSKEKVNLTKTKILQKAKKMEKDLDKTRDKLREIKTKGVLVYHKSTADSLTEYVDFVANLEKMGDQCYNIFQLLSKTK